MSPDIEKPTPSLASLDEKLSALKQLQPTAAKDAGLQGKQQAYRAASDFAAATVVGSLLGYGIDMLGHSSPFGLIGGLVVGVIAGFRMMMRAINPSQGDRN